MKWLAWFVIASIGCALSFSVPTGAQTLRIQPLEYRTNLKTGEIQKGFIDITNPGDKPSLVRVDVRGFRQIDNQGTLQFYENEQITAGVLPDLNDFELGSNETVRMFFHVDGSKLPSGDVFAAIFATAQEADIKSGTHQTIRAGTLLSIVNKTPGSRDARITDLNIPFFQFGSHLSGSYAVKNLANQNEVTGFYPAVTISLHPFKAEYRQPTKLVFAGMSRDSSFTIEESRLGFYKVSVAHAGSMKEQWVFMATGVWLLRAIVGLIGIILLIVIVAVWRRLRKDQMEVHDQK